ncbi:MAG: nitrous oxide reductase family maturation protein NosD [Anaerolineales bacterium]
MTGPYTSITEALAVANDGDTIEVRGGVYPALVVEKPVTLLGVDWPVIDGGGQGTVVRLNAPDIVFRGFEVRGSGIEPDRDHSGITVAAPRITIENNRLHDVLFGVYVAEADEVVVRGNDITSKTSLEEARRGDGVRLWYSQRTLIEHNSVHDARDVVAWYSNSVTIRDNVIERGRYGVHLMYDDEAVVERNHVLNNSVGLYVMYSKKVRITANQVRGQRGPSGYAIGFKDADDVTVTDNVLVDNRGGLFIDAAPFSPQGYAHYRDNVMALNDVGAIVLTSVRGAEFTGNTFWENIEQVSIQGGGDVSTANVWRGNTWSDYAGFDTQGDGVGDVPYRAERFFEGLTDREPLLRALIYSPAAQALEFAGAALPIFRPQPKLVDAAPRLQLASLPAMAAPREWFSIPMLLAALALFGLGLLCVSVGGRMVRRSATTESTENTEKPVCVNSALSVVNVSKRYGKATVLDGVLLEAQSGEAIALWGANGAGKTTLIKAILGLIDFNGTIAVCGCDVRSQGKAARCNIGYVPQEVVFYEQSVRDTLEFFARLKERIGEAENAPILQSLSSRIPSLLNRLGLAEHANKNVSVLSGGLRQRLALTVALLADPPVLLLDEPTANLDAQAQRDYLALLHTLRAEEGKTILFASHRLEEVEMLANRVAVLEHGRLVEVVTPEALLTKLMPYIKLTLWVPEAQRSDALARFTGAGMAAHLNGRGTVIVQVRAAEKMRLLNLMRDLPVTDYEMERKGLN